MMHVTDTIFPWLGNNVTIWTTATATVAAAEGGRLHSTAHFHILFYKVPAVVARGGHE